MTTHYLITMPLAATHLHAYLMAPNKRYLAPVIEQMSEIAEGAGGYLPIILATTLSTDVDTIREIISKRSEEARQHLETADDYHLTIFMMPKDDPDDIRLMKLH